MSAIRIIPVVFLCAVSFLGAGTVACAQERTGEETTRQIENLKDRLATKVAELRQIEPQAVAGRVKSVSLTQLTLETSTKQIKIELTDDIVAVNTTGSKRSQISVESVSEGSTVALFGEYDATLDILGAKVLVVSTPLPLQIAGTISEIDTDAYTIAVQSHDQGEYVLEYEKTTQTFLWNSATQETVKGGFSRLTAGDTIHVLARKNEQASKISALRILSLGSLTGATESPQIETEQ